MQLVFDHARGVEDAVDRRRSGLAPGTTTARICSTFVTSAVATMTSPPAFSMAHQARQAAADPVSGAVLPQPLGPLLARRQRRAGQEHQLRVCGAREVLGDRQAEAAEAAGDQVDPALAQRGWTALDRREGTGSWTCS